MTEGAGFVGGGFDFPAGSFHMVNKAERIFSEKQRSKLNCIANK